MNLIETIQEQILTDDVETMKQANRMIAIYDKATKQEKQVIDDLMIALCGWSMPTLFDMVRDSQESLKG